MNKFTTAFLIVCIAAVIGAAGGAAYWAVSRATDGEKEPSAVAKPNEADGGDAIAFFYQTVGAFVKGVGNNAVRAGYSLDGIEVQSYGADVLNWTIGKNGNEGFGDPVFSRLSDGTWTMTAWSTPSDPRGAAALMYHEASCPTVDEDDVLVLGPSAAAGCADTRGTSMGKSSQVFEHDGGRYVFHTIGGSIYLAKLADATHEATDLESLCVLPNDEAVSSLSELDYGESTYLFGTIDTGLLQSDTAIARRADGTWVLFVKGIAPDSGCTPNTLCELCGRSIYRTTSADLIAWTDLEKVVGEASVPEATTMPDGTVRLYWQDFSDACEAENLQLANVAPISTAYELAGSHDLSSPTVTSYPDEPFETDKKIHYATNANPILLPDAEALADLAECVK